VLEDAIGEALDAAPVTLYRPAHLLGLTAGGGGIHVSLKQGDQTTQLTARLVVGADGGNSSVRRLLEIGQSERDYGQTAIVTEVTTERSNGHTAYERFTASGPLALLPMGKRRSSVVWTLSHEDAETVLGRSDADFRDLLQTAFGNWLGRLELATRRQGFPLKLIRAQRMSDERVVLIGNAVHQLHPVAGQGFNLGLRDLALLAEMLAARVQFGDDIGDRSFLESYAKARQTDLDRVIGFTDGMVRIFSNDLWLLAKARNLGLTLLNNFPPAKRLLARYAMGVGERLPRFV
jgi:2-octaprenyl-6-methoxyphenol hydroxylase